MTVEPVLRARGLVKAYPVVRWRRGRPQRRRVRALNGVDLDLRPGECLGIVGESGCGKTTLARCLARHETVDRGSLWLDGVDLLAARGAALRRQRRRVQLVFQNSTAALDPRRSVGVSVAEGLAETDASKRAERLVELLDAVDLAPGLADRFPHQLSGGQRQRIAIARALAAEPAVLLLDEPVSALDATVRRRILRQLARLRQRFGVAIVFIGHDLGVVGAVAERLAVLYAGRVVETGPTRQILDAPRHPYTAALVEAVPDAEPGSRPVAPMAGEAPSPITPPSGCAFHPRCPRAEAICGRQTPELGPIDDRVDDRGRSIDVACHRPLLPLESGARAEPTTPRRRDP